MTLSTKVLVTVAVLIGLFEAVSVIPNSHDGGAGAAVFTGAFAAVFLVGAALVARRGSRAAAHVVGVLLLVDLAGLPFYQRQGVVDWLIQVAFGVVGAAGVAAWIGTIRERRAARLLDA